jgi:Tryptophan-associated transmembrane protein (Trp_oprn_chp)
VTGGSVTGGSVTGGTAAGGPVAGGPVAGPGDGGTAAPGQRPPGATRAAREYALVLGVAAAGALLVLLSVRQGWALVVTAAPAPIPGSTVTVSGQAIVPLAGALAVASLAGLAAVIATRGLARRLVGVFLAASGALTVLLVSARVSAAAVLAAAHGVTVSQAGSATAGGGTAGPAAQPGVFPGGSSPGVSAAAHVAMVSFPWRPLAAVGGLAVLAAGIMVAWRGPRWPAMSSRYGNTGRAERQPVADSASLWESLSKGVDPTEQPGPTGRPLGS